MRTFLLTDKTESYQEILGKLHTSGLNFRRIKRIENGLPYQCFAIEANSKSEQKTVLNLAKNTGNLSFLVAVKDNLSVEKGSDIIGKFKRVVTKSDNCFIDASNIWTIQ